MNPEQQRQLSEVYGWMQARKRRQLTAPFDDDSRAVLGAWTGDGVGSIELTEAVTVGSVPTILTIPKAPSGVRLVNIGGSAFYIPYFPAS